MDGRGGLGAADASAVPLTREHHNGFAWRDGDGRVSMVLHANGFWNSGRKWLRGLKISLYGSLSCEICTHLLNQASLGAETPQAETRRMVSGPSHGGSPLQKGRFTSHVPDHAESASLCHRRAPREWRARTSSPPTTSGDPFRPPRSSGANQHVWCHWRRLLEHGEFRRV